MARRCGCMTRGSTRGTFCGAIRCASFMRGRSAKRLVQAFQSVFGWAPGGLAIMVALMVDSKAKVDALHRKALQLGAKDEGPAGPRGEGFYAGYFRDLDGNKLNFFYMG